MRLRINGETRELADSLSLLELIKDLDLPPERIAIELNRNVVRRGEWASTRLKEDDHIEIVHFVGGGSELAAAVRMNADQKTKSQVANNARLQSDH